VREEGAELRTLLLARGNSRHPVVQQEAEDEQRVADDPHGHHAQREGPVCRVLGAVAVDTQVVLEVLAVVREVRAHEPGQYYLRHLSTVPLGRGGRVSGNSAGHAA
jgi:hypothetical protein